MKIEGIYFHCARLLRIFVACAPFILLRLGNANKLALRSARLLRIFVACAPFILLRLGNANKLALRSASAYICDQNPKR